MEQGKIFVFGSNLAGRHGKGAALHAATHHGAQRGVGRGRTGNAYAIPTKDEHLRVLDREMIKGEVDLFLEYARANPQEIFYLTPVGTGLSGYSQYTMRQLFKGTPANVEWAPSWDEHHEGDDPF
jgi:hypothetical protein